MSSKFNIDLLGKRFGQFTVTRKTGEYTVEHGYPGYQKWECECDCGSHFISNSRSIIKGNTSCGTNHIKYPILTGLSFGKLVVVKPFIGQKHIGRSKWWHCSCSCGGIAIVRTTDLINHKMTSCSACAKIRYSDRSIPAKKALYLQYKKSANKRGLIFELTIDIFEKLTSSDCIYCGSPPNQIYETNIEKKGINRGIYKYNGIDRVNNKIGYTEENCVPCCKFCNSAKHDIELPEFIEWSLKLCRNLEKQNYAK